MSTQVVIEAPRAAPTAPRSVSIRPADGTDETLEIRWVSPAADNGRRVETYRIEYDSISSRFEAANLAISNVASALEL